MAEARRTEAVDVDGDRLLEACEESEVLLGVHRGHPWPAAALGIRSNCSICVAAHEPGRNLQSPDERKGLAWKRSPREIAAENNQVGLGELELRQHGLERGRVSVDVGKCGDAHR